MNIDKNFSLTTIIDKIKSNEILLPDFQRPFVWTQADRQASLISSVLAKMPIGSILLLEGESNEFAVRKIGMKETYSIDSENTTIDYLLDGQQRITVLACAFSDAIAKNELDTQPRKAGTVATSLKRRFFLRFPLYTELSDNPVFFGAKYLRFPYDPNKYEQYPNFIADEIKEQLVMYPYSKSGKNSELPFNPSYTPTTTGLEVKELMDWCMNNRSNGFLIPLYLICEDTQTNSPLSKIIRAIGRDYKEAICSLFEAKESEDERDQFARSFFPEQYAEYQDEIAKGKSSTDVFCKIIEEMATQWADNLRAYLVSCTTNLFQIMSIIEVKKSERARAIDIYENLNRGGVSLSIFDLVTAKASLHSDNKDFVNKISKMIKKELTDEEEASLYCYSYTRVHSFDPIRKTYLESCGCLKGSGDGELNSKFVDVFLNNLSLLSYSYRVTDEQPTANDVQFAKGIIDLEKINIEYTKRNAKLDLNTDQIYYNFKEVCKGIDRALFFLKHRCGIRQINDIPYNHVLSILSFIFINDDYFKNRKIHDILEAWYWSVMFSGEFDKDQNTQFITHLKNLLRRLPEHRTNDLCTWITSLSSRVFAKDGFSDERILVMEDDSPVAAKQSIQNAILQYYLSTYYHNFSMREEDSPYIVEINSYTDDIYNPTIDGGTKKRKYKLEVHHIIPLASMADYEEKKRRDQNYYGNSPLNKLYIVSEDNGAISDDDISIYIQRITDMDLRRKLDLFVGDYAEKIEDINDALKYDPASLRSKDNVIRLYKIRFEALSATVKKEIKELLKLPAPSV